MGFFDDDNDYFDDDRFFREYSGGAFGDDDDELLTFEEQELKDAGIDLDEFELMDDKKKKEILEDNFLDPDDFRDMFDDDSILDEDDRTYSYINNLKSTDSGQKEPKKKVIITKKGRVIELSDESTQTSVSNANTSNDNFKILRRYSQPENKDNSSDNASDSGLSKENDNKSNKDNKPPYKMNLTVPIIIFVIGLLNIIFGAIDSSVPEKEALKSMHNGHGNPNATGPIGAVLGLIAAIVGMCMIFNEIIKYTDSLPPKEKEVNNKVYDLKKENKKDLIKLAVITFALIFGISAIVHMKGGNTTSNPEDVIQEFFDTYEEDYDYTVGDVENENDTYRELVNIATWYDEKYQYIYSWRRSDTDFFKKKNIKYSDYKDEVSEEVKRKYKELEDIMVGYVSELIDKSDKKFKDRKDVIIKQMKDGAFYLADAKLNVSKKQYEEAFDYAIQFGDKPSNNIVVETMNALYPTEMKRGCNAYIKAAEDRSLNSQINMLRYVRRYYGGIGKVDANLNSKIDKLAKELRKQSTSGNSNSNSSSSSSHSSGSSSSSSGKKTESTTVDPMDHDIDLYYEDYKDEFEDEDDAWDDFEDNDEYWDDY